MPQVCTVCKHESRAEIDAALLKNEPLRDIAGQYDLSKGALDRHKKGHITEALAKAKEAEAVSDADSLLNEVQALLTEAKELMAEARKGKGVKPGENVRTALLGVREVRACMELLAKLRGQLNEGANVNILINPQWVTIRAVLLQALAPFADARVAVAKSLQELEAGAGSVVVSGAGNGVGSGVSNGS